MDYRAEVRKRRSAGRSGQHIHSNGNHKRSLKGSGFVAVGVCFLPIQISAFNSQWHRKMLAVAARYVYFLTEVFLTEEHQMEVLPCNASEIHF